MSETYDRQKFLQMVHASNHQYTLAIEEEKANNKKDYEAKKLRSADDGFVKSVQLGAEDEKVMSFERFDVYRTDWEQSCPYCGGEMNCGCNEMKHKF